MDDFPRIQTRFADAQAIPELAGFLSIFTVPVLVLFADGKEIMREARFVHVDEFRRKIDKIYGGYHSSDQ
ncbi:thioredoxin family protein [Planococcus salinus]|uniref:thioredoxin family protein n=1 Tax=Planococcus salinus TaxID=1848460 RepID=UPI001F02CC63|nr:thioredoxin family protein [Planococcus salinus]